MRNVCGWVVGFAVGTACAGTADEKGSAAEGRVDSRGQALETSGAVFRSVRVLAVEMAPLSSVYPSVVERFPDQVEEALPECEEEPSGVTRAACPETAPEVAECDREGLECRYADGAGCAAFYECVYGLWTHIGEECEAESAAPIASGEGECPAQTPLPDSPCMPSELQCEYSPCSIGDERQLQFNCLCGRWTLTHNRCPID